MQKEFEKAHSGLLNLDITDKSNEKAFNELFGAMINSSMQICNSTDFNALVDEKIKAAEAKYGKKMEASEADGDAYKKLREVVRFEMAEEARAAGKEFELCCTETNYAIAVGKFREELEKIIPKEQMEVFDSMAHSLYSDFTNFFVCASFDMIADAKIYEMPEFRPLQLNAMGKEVRTYVNVIKQQNAKPQKSKVVTNWFNVMMVLPSFLFKKLYAVNFTPMYDVPQKIRDDAANMFKLFDAQMQNYSPSCEYAILEKFLEKLDLANCLTVRPKQETPKKSGPKQPMVN